MFTTIGTLTVVLLSGLSASDELFAEKNLSTSPDAKAHWKFTRARAQDVDGPVPLILVHGLSTDFWEAFETWAADSDDADIFRQTFQLWKYLTPNDGVNAAVGFGTDYAGFDESLAAYLNRFIEKAETEGTRGTDGNRYFFPEGPFCMLTHSQGGVTARAFLANFPAKAERCLGVVTLSAPHMGSPGATPEWVRYTLADLGIPPVFLRQIIRGNVSDFVVNAYLSTERQSDMDMGWANFDADGIGGIPTRQFRAWFPGQGFQLRTLSPRDANLTDARATPGIDDETFEPTELLPNYCGGMDLITPETRGGMNMDKFFLYGAYLQPGADLPELIQQLRDADNRDGSIYNVVLRLLSLLMGRMQSAGSNPPLGVYLLNDGFVPLQSQLMLDGKETRLLYKTTQIGPIVLPKRPLSPRTRLIRQHTLANPDRIRILEGWSHYDTVTGRYNPATKTSPLFSQVANDLLSVVP